MPPKKILKKPRRTARRTRVEESEPRVRAQEAPPTTRLEQLQKALRKIPFGFTIFFTNERGKSVKFYQGAVEQENAQ